MAEKVVVDLEFKSSGSSKKAKTEVEELKDELKGVKEQLEDIKKVQKSSDSALKGLAKGFKGVGLAMKAMGVGLIIDAFNILKEIIMQNQPVVDALDVAMTGLGIIFNQVADVVTNFGMQIFNAFSQPQKTIDSIRDKLIGFKDYIVDKFSGVGTILKGIFTFDMDMIKSGLEEVKGDFNDFKDDVTDVYENVKEVATSTFTKIVEEGKKALDSAQSLVEQRKQVELLEAQQQKLNFEYLREQELQRQIRDDVTKTFDERMEANKLLGESLTKQFEDEQRIVDAKIKLAKDELAVNSDSIELQKALIEAETEAADLAERITGFRSEQLTNEVALIQEKKAAQEELRIATMNEREAELEALRQDYEAKLELARLAGEDNLALTEQYNQAVLDANQKFADEDQAIADKKLADEKATKSAQLDIIRNSIAMAGNLFAEGTAASKVAGVATATIDTYKAATMALASAPPPLSYISAALAVATGLKNVKEILSVKTEKPTPTSGGGGGGGGIPSGASGGGEQLIDLTDTPSLVEQFNQDFQQEQPVQAFVVEQDVTNAQQINTQIQQKATL